MADTSLPLRLGKLLQTIRGVHLRDELWSSAEHGYSPASLHPLAIISALIASLQRDGYEKEGGALVHTLSIATAPTTFGGMELSWAEEMSTSEVDELVLLASACTRPSWLFCVAFF